MAWKFLKLIQVSSEWQYTSSFPGKMVKLEQTLFPVPPKSLRGIIAQCSSKSFPREIYRSAIFYYTEQNQIFEFIPPDFVWNGRGLALRGLFYTKLYRWQIRIYYWE